MVEKKHDLYDFMRQISFEMSAEYERIQKRATEDPGTAGDQGEENWAELLREWLPRTYEVVTKGRIISEEGVTSPQVDVLVLKGAYPKKLLNKKLYLAAGVAAAFECKTTLKASHIREAVENCIAFKKLYPLRTGTPYRELHVPLIYGLLAHSHSWKSAASNPEQNIEQSLHEFDESYVSHPRLQLDVLCVADLATWAASKIVFIGPGHLKENWTPVMVEHYGLHGSAVSSFVGHTQSLKGQVERFTPIGVLISHLCQKLAWEEQSLRDLPDYYRVTNIAGAGKGAMRKWSGSIYTDEVRTRVEAGGFSSGKAWDEWQMSFP